MSGSRRGRVLESRSDWGRYTCTGGNRQRPGRESASLTSDDAGKSENGSEANHVVYSDADRLTKKLTEERAWKSRERSEGFAERVDGGRGERGGWE